MTTAAIIMWALFFSLTIYGHVAMKLAANSITAEGAQYFWALARNIWSVTAVLAWLVSGLIWMIILKKQPLMQAQSIAAISYALICLSAIAFLGESFSGGKAFGIALIAVGIYFVAR